MKVVVSVDYELEVPDHMRVNDICEHVLNSGMNLWSQYGNIVWNDTQIKNIQLSYAYPETRE